MGKHIYLQCDCCGAKSESESLPDNWTWLLCGGDNWNKDRCYCSIHCLFSDIANGDASIIGNHSFHADFLRNGAMEYKRLYDNNETLQGKFDNAKRVTETVVNGKDKGKNEGKEKREYNRLEKKEKQILKDNPVFNDAFAALCNTFRDRQYKRSSIYNRWYVIHNVKDGTPILDKQDTKEFDSIKRNSKPLIEADKASTPRPTSEGAIKSKTNIKAYFYYSDSHLQWLEAVLHKEFVKSDLTMDRMKDEWAIQKRMTSSSMVTSKDQIPDAAYLRYDGYYSFWIPENQIHAIVSAIEANGSMENLLESE